MLRTCVYAARKTSDSALVKVAALSIGDGYRGVHLMDYREAGVDVEAGRAFVDRIGTMIKRTYRPEVLSGIGGFSGLFQLPTGYREPVLVSGTDGVGTKLKLAHTLNRHDTVGVDLVAMCVNDVLTYGAEPLFFLDYLATGHLHPEQLAEVVSGIVQGCELAGCAPHAAAGQPPPHAQHGRLWPGSHRLPRCGRLKGDRHAESRPG